MPRVGKERQSAKAKEVASEKQKTETAEARPAAIREETLNPFKTALWNSDSAADLMDLDPNIREQMRLPERELTVNFPVKMRDGDFKMFTGYRVQHNTARGPAKGGIRYHPDITLDEIRALASWMTWKRAVFNVHRFFRWGSIQLGNDCKKG